MICGRGKKEGEEGKSQVASCSLTWFLLFSSPIAGKEADPCGGSKAALPPSSVEEAIACIDSTGLTRALFKTVQKGTCTQISRDSCIFVG